MACDKIAGLKTIEVFLCIVCLLYKFMTVWETLIIFYELEKQSREWHLSRRLSVDRTGSIFSDIVLGSYVIITIGLLIGHYKGELVRAKTTEGFFLVLGTILFLIVGGLSITSVDELPQQLVDNGIILGILTIITAILFLLDISLTRKQPGQIDTKKPLKIKQQTQKTQKPETKQMQLQKVEEQDTDKNKKKSVFDELKSSLKRRSQDGETNPRNSIGDVKSVEFQERELQNNEEQKRPSIAKSSQVGRRNMDNRGFSSHAPTNEEELFTSRLTIEADEFEKSFNTIENPNGFIKNESRQSAFNLRDDERFESKDIGRNRQENKEHLVQHDELNSGMAKDHHKSNGYVRSAEPQYSPRNDQVRHVDEVDFRKKVSDEEFQRSNEYARRMEEYHNQSSNYKERRHSIDYSEYDDKVHPLRSDDRLRKSLDVDKRRNTNVDGSQRFYRSDADSNRPDLSQSRYQFEDLRKPEYAEDRKSYKGYADTVKYLEETSSERHKRIVDDDSAMPPKHITELEMDDHYYKPVDYRNKKSNRNQEHRNIVQEPKITSSQRSGNNSSDDSELIPQIPSVSFLLSERGRKIMPSLSASPVERIERSPTPKYYFADPSSPGYVKQTASHWPAPSPINAPEPKHHSSSGVI